MGKSIYLSNSQGKSTYPLTKGSYWLSSGPSAAFRARYWPSGEITHDHLARWLAERYCAYTLDASGRPLRIDIHHPPWPLQPAEGELDAQGMADQIGIELEGEPLLLFSARQDTLIWPLRPA